jgi:hypothetical protein
MVRPNRVRQVGNIRLARLDGRGGVLAVARGSLGDGLGLGANLCPFKFFTDSLYGGSTGAGDAAVALV